MKSQTNRMFVLMSIALALSMILAACSGDEETSVDGEAGSSGAPEPQQTDAADSDASGTEDDVEPTEPEAATADLQGQTVEVIYGFAGDDEVAFQEVLNQWAEPLGVEVVTESTSGQPQLVDIRVESGNPPDVALFPNPSRLQGFYDTDDLVALGDIIDRPTAEESMVGGLLDIGEVDDGSLVGIPYRLSVKSLVWHPAPEFSDAGYEAPQTWDEMMALGEQIQKDGTSPWCIGIESGGATGWPATDWMEEILLRTAGPEFYDQWVNHGVPFNAPEVINAGEIFAEIAFADGLVRGGQQSMVTTNFGDSPQGLFDDPPKCYMHRQGNFITGFFPEAVQEDLASGVGVFPFPDIDPEYENLVMGAGDYVALFTDNPAAEELVRYLTTAESGEIWAAEGGYLSPHTTFDTGLYPDDITRDIGQQLVDAEGFRFDGSDLMVTEIGAGVFWTEMTAWINGTSDLETALTNIENAWTALEE